MTRRAEPFPARMKALAIQMYGDGDAWSPTEIARYLAEHAAPGERTPRRNTIAYWVRDIPMSDELRQRDAARQRILRARRTLEELEGHDRAGLSAPQLDARMLELRRHGLPYSAIATIAEVYHGQALTADQVRARLRKHGVKPHPARSAAMRRHWAQTTVRNGTAAS